jgi:hypothetical protein
MRAALEGGVATSRPKNLDSCGAECCFRAFLLEPIEGLSGKPKNLACSGQLRLSGQSGPRKFMIGAECGGTVCSRNRQLLNGKHPPSLP